ncbi:hypothetical protein [Yersinia intermedia]|uniref:hypothetical protein n=1 Tax=Yersinia intermedia TaxID=631 RepID=UPI000B67A835|nr:hypothetical protein [Yersinia intermedia]OVZ78114.1 hypothetical protein CBW55_01920 [Yersinia intermedia]
MPKENQLCLSATLQSWPIPFMAQPWAPPITEDNLSLLTMSSIMAQFTSLQEEKILPLKVTARDHELLEKMAQELPNVSSTSDPVFSQAMPLIDSARVLDQKTWTQQFPAISDARVGRIVDFYLQLHAVEGLESANSLDDLSHLRSGLTAAQGYEKARVISLERDILFKLCQKSLTLSTEEKLTPLAALSLAWWLNQEYQPTLAELSMAVYRPENKETKLQAAILYNHSHYGNSYGETAGISTADLNDWGLEHLDSPELAVSRAARVLRVIHEGMDAQPTILQAPEAYLANGFAPKNAQGSYLKKESLELGEMILTGCGQIGFDACSQQDFTQFIDFEHAVGSLAFSLKTTLKLHYQLQGRAFDELVDKNTEQLYTLLLQEEEQLHKSGGARYSPTAIFLSHFSQSNEVEPLTVEQTAGVIKRIAGSIDVSHLSESAQVTFNRINLMVDNVVAGTAIDVEHERFVSDLKSLAQLTEQSHPLYILAHYRLYKTAQEKIERQLAYLDMRLAYRHLPAAFDDDQAIREILTEAGVEKVDDSRAYYYRYSDPHKQNDSPVNEFKRRRDASNRFVANMSMPGKNGRSIDVYKTLDAKKTEYHEWIKSHPAVRSQAIKTLIEKGQRPESGALQDKINALAKDYRPETENSRFWRTAWTSLEESWVCKLPLPNPMCTIARVEGPRSRNENENMAAGMVAMVMEAGQLRGMERGVKLIENSPLGVKPSGPLAPPSRPVIPSRLPVAEGEVIPTRQTIPSPPGKPVEVQWVELKDPLVSGGMREAWVRQGGGATYWEVDLTTGKDVGVVLKQGPEFSRQGRLPGGGPNSFTETHILTNADFDWLEESALRPASKGDAPCALTSSGIFTYLNTSEMSLAEKFFGPLRDNVAASRTSGKFLHQILEQFKAEGIQTDVSIFQKNLRDPLSSFNQAIESFPERVNVYPLDLNAIKMEISSLKPGESMIFFPERAHVITIVQTANKEGLYVFDTNLMNVERLKLMDPRVRKFYKDLVPELIIQEDKKYLSGHDAAMLLDMYFRSSSERNNTGAAIIRYKGRTAQAHQ